MGNELQIDINPDGADKFGLILKAQILKIKDPGKFYARGAWNLDGLKLEALRLGMAPDEIVREVTEEVSRWLLAADLNESIDNAIGLAEDKEPLRIIFSVADHETRRKLNSLPLELVTLKDTPSALVLSTKVVSLVHLLPNARQFEGGVTSNDWPLKILIVRTNPNELGGAIPPAAEISESIRKIWRDAPALDPSLLRVDVLSYEGEEPAGMELAGRPTIKAFKDQLLKVDYDILIYVGHGDVKPSVPGGLGGGFLQFENEQRTGRAEYMADELADALKRHPVPVVLLMGCVTAVDRPAAPGGPTPAADAWVDSLPDDKREFVPKELPNWILGNQGVAQALIDGSTGVQVAVGMQYQITTDGAKHFLEKFFFSLLKNSDVELRGNVEEAVRVARASLNEAKYRYMWSAPVFFSRLRPEPLFPFLKKPPQCQTFDDPTQTTRTRLWRLLSLATWQERANVPVVKDMVREMRETLEDLERRMAEKTRESNASVLMPALVEVEKAGEEVRVPVVLHGELKGVKSIEGLIQGLGELKISALQISPELKARDFRVGLTDAEKGEFQLSHRGGGGDLAAGELFTCVLAPAAAPKPPVNLRLYELKVEPSQTLCPGDNAVIFPRPGP